MTNVTVSDLVDVFQCCFFNWGFLTVILPAFLLAAGITVFVDPFVVISGIGGRFSKARSHISASLAGYIIPVCSCNIVPIFDSITRKGAAIGPAYTFLYAAPAVHIINLVFTWNVIGPFLAVGRLIGVFIISILIGVTMEYFTGQTEGEQNGKATEQSSSPNNQASALSDAAGDAVQSAGNAVQAVVYEESQSLVVEHGESRRVLGWAMSLLLALIIVGSILTVPGHTFGTGLSYFPYILALFIALVTAFLGVVFKGMTASGRREWVSETFNIFKTVVPFFLVGVFLAALLAKVIPISLAHKFFLTSSDAGGNPTFLSNLRCAFSGSLVGEVVYFPILTEVAFVKALLKEGVCSVATAMALLLAGPGTSLPGLILIYRFQGARRVLLYFALSVFFAALYSTAFGWFHYTCACTFM